MKYSLRTMGHFILKMCKNHFGADQDRISIFASMNILLSVDTYRDNICPISSDCVIIFEQFCLGDWERIIIGINRFLDGNVQKK